ncbi:phenylalanine and histidine ammonia-lyase [Xylaria longipes]|nr:phenylalanine and histidine ammonia-lyase [Xylaria longipes]
MATHENITNLFTCHPFDTMVSHTEVILDAWRHLYALISLEDVKHLEPISLTGNKLTIPDIVAIARYEAVTEIKNTALESMEHSLSVLQNGLRDGHVIYGVNTGFGGTADVRTKKVVELQHALIRELHYGVLPPGKRDHHTSFHNSSWGNYRYDLFLDRGGDSCYMPWSWTRAAIAIRINSLISGHSAVRPVIVERMQDLLNYNIIPMIPLRGSISASGDLSPLSYICGAISGKSTIRVLSKSAEAKYADEAFADAGLESVKLQMKEGLAMTNGTAISAAVAALCLHDTHTLALFAQIMTAMTVEALNGTTESFHSFFSESRPHPGQTECARNILAFLIGSKLTKINDGANSSLRQDRYSIRTAPQWLGPLLEDLILAHQQVSIECNSATDNPLVTPEGKFLHGGNFQAKSVTSAMEKTRQAVQGIGRMIFSQCTELMNPATNRGLPPNLIAEDPSISLIFKGTDLNIAALAAELGFLANPVNHVQTAEMGNQSLNSLALISARYTETANDVLSQLIAAHLIAVCQALDLRAMNMQFLELYESQFRGLLAGHYSMVGEPSPSSNGVHLTANLLSSHANDLSELVMSQPPFNTPDQGPASSLEELNKGLWSQLMVSLDTTASMDASERFGAVAKSLRPIMLDSPVFNQDLKFISRLTAFTEALSVSMHDAWCANRDAYLVHGDATPLLGKASKAIYTFIRRTLRVPFLSTRNLMTPTLDEMESGCGVNGTQAPTVGSFTGAVYRALRDGSLMEVGIEVLKTCVYQETAGSCKSELDLTS